MKFLVSALYIPMAIALFNFADIRILLAQETKTESTLDLSIAIKEIGPLAQSDIIVEAVTKHNSLASSELTQMTNEKWKELSPADSIVKKYMNNEAALFLKSKIPSYVSEIFVSGADGKKVAFTRKTTYWDHSGKAKHEWPMQGKRWQGPEVLDESTGKYQIQISEPIFKDGKVIGSMVIGISVIDFKRVYGK